MEQKLNCNIVKDLLPNYIEELTSEVTGKSIKEHLETCQDCECTYRQMKGNIPSEVDVAPETRTLKKFLNKIKYIYFARVMLILAAIAIVTCLIVNLAVNRGLSWSLLVIGGILLGYIPGHLLLYSAKNRIIKSLVGVSVLLIPFLMLVQAVSYYYFKMPSLWIWDKGIPLSLLWLMITWIPVLICKLFKLNFYYGLAILALLSPAGNFLTGMIVGDYTQLSEGIEAFIRMQISNTVGVILVAVIVIAVSAYLKKRGDQKNKNADGQN